ncbi:MAG: hypothetical protein IJS07_02280 [Bacteroidales bacterium]|nr:hypothetical protein [Bacteroidales bacterium]
MTQKLNRKEQLKALIVKKKLHTQEELARALEGIGIVVAQATLSRDLKEIGAVKMVDPQGGFYYALPSVTGAAPVAKANMHVDSVEASGQLCVLHCLPGFASAVASLVDREKLPGVMGTIAGDDTVLVALQAEVDSKEISSELKSMFNVIDIDVRVATAADKVFAEAICEEIYISSQERKTGIARRTPEYIKEKMDAGKAVIAVTSSGEFAGFSYIESWGGKSFVANSGLIVAHKFRGMGLAKRIKEKTFILSRTLFPKAKIFSITTGAAVMKMNYEFGFRPVPYTELTDDPEFWKGCQGCRHYDILKSHDFKMCICTGLLYDPEEHLEIHNPYGE